MKITLASDNYADMYYMDQQPRDVLLIIPGGGYEHASLRESKPVVDQFQPLGLHAVVYRYRETKLVHPHVYKEAFELMKILKEDPLIKNIHVIGFSAGGHLALMLLEKYASYFSSGILCYPVVSNQPHLYHGGSFKNLVGKALTKDLKHELSLEKHVHKDMPPIFIFHTVDDSVVPIGNSLVLIEALHGAGVYVEAHLFPYGRHGVSVVTEETPFEEDGKTFMKRYGYLHAWVDLAKDFLKRIMK